VPISPREKTLEGGKTQGSYVPGFGVKSQLVVADSHVVLDPEEGGSLANLAMQYSKCWRNT
jgi:hypothetical protein